MTQEECKEVIIEIESIMEQFNIAITIEGDVAALLNTLMRRLKTKVLGLSSIEEAHAQPLT